MIMIASNWSACWSIKTDYASWLDYFVYMIFWFLCARQSYNVDIYLCLLLSDLWSVLLDVAHKYTRFYYNPISEYFAAKP